MTVNEYREMLKNKQVIHEAYGTQKTVRKMPEKDNTIWLPDNMIIEFATWCQGRKEQPTKNDLKTFIKLNKSKMQ